MDQDVQTAFDNLTRKIDDFILAQTRLCGERGTAIGKLEQRFDNGEKEEDKGIKKKANQIAWDRWLTSVGVLAIGIWTVIKEFI